MGVNKRRKGEPKPERIHMECGLPWAQHSYASKGETICPDEIPPLPPSRQHRLDLEAAQNPVDPDREDAYWDALDEDGTPFGLDAEEDAWPYDD